MFVLTFILFSKPKDVRNAENVLDKTRPGFTHGIAAVSGWFKGVLEMLRSWRISTGASFSKFSYTELRWLFTYVARPASYSQSFEFIETCKVANPSRLHVSARIKSLNRIEYLEFRIFNGSSTNSILYIVRENIANLESNLELL